MSSELRNSAKRVQVFLSNLGFLFNVKELPGYTRTAKEAAEIIGCSVSQIAKSLIFKENKTNRPTLVIASGSNQVDLKKIQKVIGLKLAKAEGKFVKDKVGYAIGGVPPVAHIEHLETLLDNDLKKYETIWAAAGTPFAVFQLKPDDLKSLTKGRWIDLSE
ncbi:MAG TPA: YbaK/EbsC family protein [Gammaproteobacteria bacterium]|nr:YbaK/EbsC family protein [Gammaproteobacteria bacterium]